ncbi:MAG: DNA-binding protein [Gordonia sp. (in: high G+C Gram-positive bacteria)]|uniref:DNA-binding protein n=1 Tax=Gordonia sp. (in: high G+C Gram-positive bacteria) TaxID=84139 RepID=UPI0039E54E32
MLVENTPDAPETADDRAAALEAAWQELVDEGSEPTNARLRAATGYGQTTVAGWARAKRREVAAAARGAAPMPEGLVDDLRPLWERALDIARGQLAAEHQAQLTAADAEADRALAAQEMAETQLTTTTAELGELRVALDAAERAAEDLRRAAGTHEAAMSAAEAARTKAEKAARAAEIAHAEIGGEIRAVRLELAAEQTARAELAERLSVVTTARDDAAENLRTARAEVADLTRRLTEADTELTAERQAATEAGERARSAELATERAETEAATLREVLAALRPAGGDENAE